MGLDEWICFLFRLWQDNLSFPLICADWNADEEILLLEVYYIHWLFKLDWTVELYHYYKSNDLFFLPYVQIY